MCCRLSSHNVILLRDPLHCYTTYIKCSCCRNCCYLYNLFLLKRENLQLILRYSLFPENCLLKEFMQIHGLKGFQVFFFAKKYFESIDPYLSNVVRVACSKKFILFYVHGKSSTRCSSTLLQLYIADNLMNFYRLSIKALRQRKFYNNTRKSCERN